MYCRNASRFANASSRFPTSSGLRTGFGGGLYHFAWYGAYFATPPLNLPFRGGAVDEGMNPVVREEIIEDERGLDLLRGIVHVPIPVIAEGPPDDPVVFLR